MDSQEELKISREEQSQSNNDLVNLLGSVEIPIVMLGDDRRVRRFTPLAGKALNLIATDVERPSSDLKVNFNSPVGELDLETMVTNSIETLVSQELEVQDRHGHWFRLQVRPYKTVDNKIDGAVFALVDIDSLKISLKEVKEARAEADRANRAKDLFLATLSHELRTPLTVIFSWAQLFRSGKMDPVKIKRGAEVIEESGNTQAQLINDLLDVSRIIAGKLPLEIWEVNPELVVFSAVEAIRPTAEAKAMIQVIDAGKGIAQDFLPKIFDRFSQEDSFNLRLHGGLGLGPAIVRNLVELHGGTIKAEGLGERAGSVFTVMLPIKSDQELLGSQVINFDWKKYSLADGIFPLKLDGIRILIVDNEANAREAISELFQSFWGDVKAANSVEHAPKLFTQFKHHVLVSDIAMPVEDGYDLIKIIRALSSAKG